MDMSDYWSIFERMPKKVSIADVTVRDGFQSEEKRISTEAKKYYLSELVFAGAKRIEVTNLGNPYVMPQFEDAEEMLRFVRSEGFKSKCARKGVNYDDLVFTAITIREDAVDRAVEFAEQGIGPDRLLMMVSTDEEHHYVNTGTTLPQYWKEAERSIEKCHRVGIKMCGTVSTIWGSPITGPTKMSDALDLTQQWLDIGADDIEHSDHDGSGISTEVYRYFCSVLDRFPNTDLHIAHFHETKRIGSASVLAALHAGITHFEASLGGIGGQPANFFEDRPVPGTGKYYHVEPGIIPLEDMIVQIDEMGIETGYNIERVLWLGRQLERTLGRRLRSNASKNGRTLREGRMELARPGLQKRKQQLGEI